MQAKKSRRNSQGIYVAFTLPALLLYLFFVVYPMVSGLYYSLTDWNGISPTYNFVGLKNYIHYFHDQRSLSVVGRTLGYTFALVVIVIVLALLIASLLNTQIKARGLFRSIFFFPAVLSGITIGLIFNQIYYQLVPMLGKTLGIEWLSVNPLSDARTAMPAILLINVWQGMATPTVILLAGMQSVSNDLYEAASIDGANAWQRFCRITLPLILPSVAVVSILNIRSGLMVFDYIKATTNGGPAFSTMSIATLIYKHAFTDMKFAYSAAESCLVFVATTVLAVIQLAVTRERT